jgi:hypothetical protein
MGAITEAARDPLGLTFSDQQSIDDFENFWGREVLDNPLIGFNHYWNTSMGSPFKDPGMIDLWVRKDGNRIFTIRNGHAIHPKSEDLILQGYPFGLWPRRLQAIINAQIIRGKGVRDIYVGPAFTPYLRSRIGGIDMTGGKTGNIARAKEQMLRMSVATYRFYIRGEKGGAMYNPSPMIEKCGVYFGEDAENWPMMLTVSKPYAESICTEGNAVPVDIAALMKIKGPMEHDIYSWLVRRVFGVQDRKPVPLTWGNMYQQFGRTTYNTMYHFQHDFRSTITHLRKEVYPDLKFEERGGKWWLSKSKLAVPEKKYWRGFVEERQLSLLPPDPDEPDEVLEKLVVASTLNIGDTRKKRSATPRIIPVV